MPQRLGSWIGSFARAAGIAVSVALAAAAPATAIRYDFSGTYDSYNQGNWFDHSFAGYLIFDTAAPSVDAGNGYRLYETGSLAMNIDGREITAELNSSVSPNGASPRYINGYDWYFTRSGLYLSSNGNPGSFELYFNGDYYFEAGDGSYQYSADVAGAHPEGGIVDSIHITNYHYPDDGGRDTTVFQVHGSRQGDHPLQFYSYALTPSTPGDTSTVPEPASWAMMILGFGVVGCTLRRDRRTRLDFRLIGHAPARRRRSAWKAHENDRPFSFGTRQRDSVQATAAPEARRAPGSPPPRP